MTASDSDTQFLLNEKYNGKKTPEFFSDLDRLAKGEPVAYLIGWVPFLGCKIFLDSHPLIPRPETEFWTERAIESLRTSSIYGTGAEIHALDLFAGSGAIGVAVLKHIPEAQVDFADIDPSHFPTIQKNIRENDLPMGQTKLIETDVWSAISGHYDLICANPPYLQRESTRVADSVRTYEPKNALFAEDNGFALIQKTISGLHQHLTPHGIAYIEHEPEHAERIRISAEKIGLTAQTFKDQYGVLRYSLFVLKAGT